MRVTRVSWHSYHPERDQTRDKASELQALKPTMARGRAPKERPMEIPDFFETPDSSLIERACYDRPTKVLSVYLKGKNGAVQRYDGAPVPLTIWEQFYQSESKGQYFNLHIRPIFKMEKVLQQKAG